MVGAGFWIISLVAYLATGRIARRSPHYGGGTVVLSWIGLLVPCIAWIAMYQGWNALDRAVAEATPTTLPARTKDRSRFIVWVLVYVFAAVAGGAVARQ